VVALFSGELRWRALFGVAGMGDVARPGDGRGESRAPGLEAAVGELRHGLPVALVRQRFDGREAEITPATIFDLCSVTKSFTAAAVWTLEADRRIALNQCVGEFVEALPDEIARIRIRQLLDHSSGLPDSSIPRGSPAIIRLRAITCRSLATIS